MIPLKLENLKHDFNNNYRNNKVCKRGNRLDIKLAKSRIQTWKKENIP